MKRSLTAALFISTFVFGPAYGQNIETLCLDAVNTGDATINCHKASYLMQQKQLEVLLEIRNTLIRNIARSTAQSAANTTAMITRLDAIARSMESQSGRPRDYLYVSELENVSGSTFTCAARDSCAEDAGNAADEVCRRLGFAGQHAFEPEVRDPAKNTVHIKWVVCRP